MGIVQLYDQSEMRRIRRGLRNADFRSAPAHRVARLRQHDLMRARGPNTGHEIGRLLKPDRRVGRVVGRRLARGCHKCAVISDTYAIFSSAPANEVQPVHPIYWPERSEKCKADEVLMLYL